VSVISIHFPQKKTVLDYNNHAEMDLIIHIIKQCFV